jgi:hypothetical protein
MVLGDLPGAIADYRSFLASPNEKNRSIAASAMLHLAQCQEKLGDRNAAQRTYMRISREYTDQADIAAQAKEKLFHWMEPVARPRNLAFEKGEVGKIPAGWFSHSAVLTRSGCRTPSCAVLDTPGDLMQTFSASAYRGKTVRIKASIRSEEARLWLRMERNNRQFATFMSPAIRSTSWTQSEISADVDDDAQSLTLGITASLRAWVESVSFVIADSDPETLRARAALQKIYDSEGRATLRSIRLDGVKAIVTARREDPSTVYTLRETWTRSAAGWKLIDSNTIDAQPRPQPTSPEQERAIAAELRGRAVALGAVEGGQAFYDLGALGFAAFGRSLGEARTVILGGAPGELKVRLTEYLIEQNGFSNIAIEGEPGPLNRYLQTGSQSALGPEWNSAEILDLLRWARAFNKTRDRRVIFSRFDGSAQSGVMWTDNDTAARLRGPGVFSAATIVRDPVLAGTHMPLFFLDLRSVPAGSELARWLAAPHVFDSDRVEILSKSYDGLIFIDRIP